MQREREAPGIAQRSRKFCARAVIVEQHSPCPALAAQNSGGLPLSRVGKFTDAPASKSTATVPVLPPRDAKASAEKPAPSEMFAGTPPWSSRLTSAAASSRSDAASVSTRAPCLCTANDEAAVDAIGQQRIRVHCFYCQMEYCCVRVGGTRCTPTRRGRGDKRVIRRRVSCIR